MIQTVETELGEELKRSMVSFPLGASQALIKRSPQNS
jgi:hypothetical protein